MKTSAGKKSEKKVLKKNNELKAEKFDNSNLKKNKKTKSEKTKKSKSEKINSKNIKELKVEKFEKSNFKKNNSKNEKSNLKKNINSKFKKENLMIIGLNEKPPIIKWILLSLQHVFAMFGATVLVPITINTLAGSEIMTIPVALVCAGIGTLIYLLCTKGRSPIFLGSSFAFITPCAIAASAGGKASVATGLMCVGLFYILISFIIKKTGKGWVNKLLPPVIVGPMIMVIGLSLAANPIEQIGLTGGAIRWQNIVIALVSFLTTAILAIKAKGFFKVIPFLMGILVGYITAIALGEVDLSLIAQAKYFQVPAFTLPFKDYEFDFTAVLTILPIAFVTIAEHIGDHKVLSTIIGKDLIEDPGLDRTLLGDGLATLSAGLIGGPANTSYGENTSVIGMSKVSSVWVIGLAAIFSISFGFLGKLTAVFQTIPAPVLGGISLLLYGFIAVNGLKTLIINQVDFNKTKNVVIASTMLILGIGGAIVSIAIEDMTISISGMSLAAVAGILLNVCIREYKE